MLWPDNFTDWCGLIGLSLLMLCVYVGGVLLLAACIGLASDD